MSAAAQKAPFRLWRSGWVWAVAVFCGFMFGAAVTAAVPASALWAGRFVCSHGATLHHESSTTDVGVNTSQDSVSFVCVAPDGHRSDAGTFPILGCQLVLGGIVSYLLIVGVGAVLWVRRR